jgi:hypothetical protein
VAVDERAGVASCRVRPPHRRPGLGLSYGVALDEVGFGVRPPTGQSAAITASV